MSLEEFIKQNSRQALSVIRKSCYLNMLDADDQSEICYDTLWKVYEKFDKERGCLSSFINMVASSYILKVVRRKMRFSREMPMGDRDFAYTKEDDISELFTESEWNSVRHLKEDSQTEAASKTSLTYTNYRILLRVIANTANKRKE